MGPLNFNDLTAVAEHSKLTNLQKDFLIHLMKVGIVVHLIESSSELLDVPDALWVRMSEDVGYYDQKAEEVRQTAHRSIAFFVTPLVQDLNIWTPDDDDKAQILEIKRARLIRKFPEDYVDETGPAELE